MKTIGEKSNDTAIIEDMLRQVIIDAMITYDAMSTALGRDVRTHCSGNLQSARRICQNDGIVFGVVRGEGYKRLSDSSIIDSSASDRKSVGRRAHRAIKKLACVKFEELNNIDKVRHTTAAAQFGVIKMFSSAKATKTIEAKATDKTMAIGQTLTLFTD